MRRDITSRHQTAHARTVSRATLVFRELRRAGSIADRDDASGGAIQPCRPRAKRAQARAMRDGDSRLFSLPVNDGLEILVGEDRCERKSLKLQGLERS